MALKRRKNFFLDEEGDPFEAMRREMDEMLKNFTGMDFEEMNFDDLPRNGGSGGSGVGDGQTGQPKVYGFSYRVGQDGKPVVQEFGNTRKAAGKNGANDKEREPLVDVIKSDCEITVIAELPGARKDEIRVRATEEELEIEAEGVGERRYSKTIRLPAKVHKGSAKASFKNGILEVKLALAEPDNKNGKPPKVCGDEVKIE